MAKRALNSLTEQMAGLPDKTSMESLFDQVLENSDIVESWRTPDGKLVYVSRSCERLHGYTAQEILASPEMLEKIIHPEDSVTWQEGIEKLLRDRGFKGKLEYRIITRDGSVKWIESAWYPLSDPSGRFFGWRATSVDITERKQLDEKHKITEARYQAILDSQTELIVRHETDGTITYLNQALVDFTGLAPGDLLGQKWFALIPSETVLLIQMMMQEMTPQKPTANFDLEAIRYDGCKRWINWRSTGIFDKGGILIELQVVGRDITEERNALIELNLKNEEMSLLYRKFSLISDTAGDIVGWALPDGTLMYLSPSAERLTGYPMDSQVHDLPVFIEEVVHPEDKSHVIEYLKESERLRESGGFSYRIITRQGTIRWFEQLNSPLKDVDGTYMGFRFSARDITERKLLEEELSKSEIRYRGIVEDQTDLICRASPDGILLYVNNAYCNYFKTSSEELINRSFKPLIPEEDRYIVENSFSLISPGEPVHSTEHRVFAPDGSIRWSSWINRGFFDEKGRLTEVQSVGRDITDQKKADQDLKRAFDEISELKQKLETENIYLKDLVMPRMATQNIVANSHAMKKVLELVQQVAPTDSTVLITGETGTGKELIARVIHQLSNRNKRMMITVNCSALPGSLIESELFGREKGAYTGALTRQIGRFEMANGSTIFLDEIGEMPMDLQVKLLRMIQFGEFERLGSPVMHKADVRIIAATNRDLNKAMKERTFREDLYYRLGVFPIHIPPLRERTDDISPLVWHFVQELSEKTGKRIDMIPRRVIERLTQYPWPGNVRELGNVIEHAMILASSRILDIAVPDSLVSQDNQLRTLEEAERHYILSILNKTGWKVRGERGAAQILGLNEATLRFRMKKLGIRRPE